MTAAAVGQRDRTYVNSADLLHEARPSTQKNAAERLLRAVVKDFAPSDLAVCSLAGDGRNHNVKQVLYFWIVDGLCNQAREYDFGFLLAISETQPSR
jgi:hypothetical protein